MISSLRRNLQREHLTRLIDLSLPGAGNGAAFKPISNLATMQLKEMADKIAGFLEEARRPGRRVYEGAPDGSRIDDP